ncbi:MAG TPA: serine hydrolase domain-containing protein [Steroidobacteraceae bacterium]|nr:serine hydrolase domain-containing protein [Steroidobacteraceae bacterium]
MNVPRLTFLWISLWVPQWLVAMPAKAATPAPAAAVSAYEQAVVTLGRKWLEDYDGIGLSIGIYDRGTRHFYNFGSTRLDGNRAPTKDTIYEIGSVGKTMTGQLLARAVVEGRATLSDEVEKYLGEPYPNLANGGEKVRLLHLANMTSQLIDNIPDLTQVRRVAGEPLDVTYMRVLGKYTAREFLAQLHRVAPRLPPGNPPVHSNVASVLLGVALEKIYGEPFDVILAREIERPLHMGSGTRPDKNRLATGYTNAGEELPPFEAKMSWAATSLRYSADDLLRYASWQMVERDASVKLAHRPTWYTPDRYQSVAMYWIGTDTPRGRRLHYAGGTYGFASLVELFPEAQLALVLLSNKATNGAQDTLRVLAAQIVETLRPPPPADETPGG